MIHILRDLYRKLPLPSTNYNLRQLKYDPYTMLERGALVLDVGSKNARGRYAAFERGPDAVNIIALDIAPVKGVDVAADALNFPFKSESIDCVVCVSMLYTVRNPEKVVAEIFRVLKPEGLFYLNTPFVSGYTPDPTDFYRFSVDGLRVLCEAFEEIQTGYNRGPASTMCDLLVHFSAILFCFNRKRLYGLLVDVFKWCLFWIKYLDKLIGHYEVAKVIHNGAFFIGRKPLNSNSISCTQTETRSKRSRKGVLTGRGH